MAHFSILFANEKTRSDFCKRKGEEFSSAAVKDLNITAIIDEIRKLTPDFPSEYLLFPPYDKDTQKLRGETAEELYGSSAVFDSMKRMASKLYTLKQHCRNIIDIKNKDARNHCFLCAVLEYCAALRYLLEITEGAASRGLAGLHGYAAELLGKAETGLYTRAQELMGKIDEMLALSLYADFMGQNIKTAVSEKEPLSDKIALLAEDILGAKLNFSFSAVNNVQISPLEEALLALMKAQNASVFEELELFYEENKLLDFYSLIDLRDEILFFTGYIEFVKKYEKAGFSFALPKTVEGTICMRNVYDISLAVKLGKPDLIVANSAEIQKGDIFVVSGANQGGKTTFLRSFGQCVFLAAHGLPVPAEKFEAPFCGFMATHFNRAETVGKSRLEDELERVRAILSAAKENSVLLFNECFVGTRRGDAVILSEKVFEKIFSLGATCGFVTHFFELALRDKRLLSFVAEAMDDASEQRTYRIVRRSPDGLAHAHSIAVSCGATYAHLLAETEKPR